MKGTRRLNRIVSAVLAFALAVTSVIAGNVSSVGAAAADKTYDHVSVSVQTQNADGSASNWTVSGVPSIYYETTVQELTCSMKAHTHKASCYHKHGILKCTEEEHTHGEGCYTTSTQWTAIPVTTMYGSRNGKEFQSAGGYHFTSNTKFKVVAAMTNGSRIVNDVTVYLTDVANFRNTGYSFYEYCRRTWCDGNNGIDIQLSVDELIENFGVAYNVDGDLLSIVDNNFYSQNDTVTITSEIPVKADYNFLGWSVAGSNTLYHAGDTYTMPHGNVTFQAVFEQQEHTATVHFVKLLSNGSFMDLAPAVTVTGVAGTTQTVESPAVFGRTPEVASTNVVVGTSDTDIYVFYNEITFHVQFVNEGVVVSDNYAPYSAVVGAPEVSKDADENYTYNFIGWDMNGDGVADFVIPAVADVTYVALYEAVENPVNVPDEVEEEIYTVLFLDNLGNVISEQHLKYGDPIVKPSNPKHAGEAGIFAYYFAGWGRTVAATCTGNDVYTAYFGKIIYLAYYKYHNTVDVLDEFYDQDGIDGRPTGHFSTVSGRTDYTNKNVYDVAQIVALLQQVYDETKNNIKVGTIDHEVIDKLVELTTGDKLAGAVDVWYVLKLENDGWHIDGGDYNDYTVRFLDDDGSVISSETYHYGDTVNVPADPTKAADNTFTYTFAGWDREIAIVTGDADYQASYTAEYIEYTVTFYDDDKTTVLGQNTYHYNDAVVVPTNPTKADDQVYSYTFAGWTPVVEMTVTKNAEYVASYDAVKRTYTITFFDDDEKTIISQKTDYNFGDTLLVPANPTKGADAIFTYTFARWNKVVAEVVTEDDYYIAIYDKEYILYTVDFVDDDDTLISTDTYIYGATVNVPADPTKASDGKFTYTFAGWTPEVEETVSGNATYKAGYTATLINYTVTFYDEDGTTILGQKNDYHFGDTVIVPVDPTKASDEAYEYFFIGWTPSVVKIVTGNASYQAVYEAVPVTIPNEEPTTEEPTTEEPTTEEPTTEEPTTEEPTTEEPTTEEPTTEEPTTEEPTTEEPTTEEPTTEEPTTEEPTTEEPTTEEPTTEEPTTEEPTTEEPTTEEPTTEEPTTEEPEVEGDEEEPTEEPTSREPEVEADEDVETGDYANAGMLISLLGASVVAASAALLIRRKKIEE